MFTLFQFFKKEDVEKAPAVMRKDPYYTELYKTYGKCRPLPKGIRIMTVADTHGALLEEEAEKAMSEDFDVCVLLGDHALKDVVYIKRYLGSHPIYGVLGNHDAFNLYRGTDVENINGRVVNVDGILLAGIEGCPRYKRYMIGYTQEECSEIMADMQGADILLSHCSAYRPDLENEGVHVGYKGISEYIFKHHVPVHIFGHNHEPKETELLNGCREICVYREDMVEL